MTSTARTDEHSDARDSGDLGDTAGAGAGASPGGGPWFMKEARLGVFLIITSVIGFLASFELSVDKVKKLENPDVTLSCDFNPFFSCGSVMEHWQSQLFGFPNQFIGVAAFIFPLLLGVLLVSGTRVPGWVMVGLNIGLLGGTALVMFLFYSSIYVIGTGCPWCIVVWAMTIPMFCVVTGYNALAGNFGSGLRESFVVRVIASSALLLSLVWLLIIAVCVVVQFWTYFGSLLR